MADTPISGLPAASAIVDADIVASSQDLAVTPITRKVTAALLKDYVFTNVDHIDFYQTFAGAMQVGRLAWDPVAGTIQVGISDTVNLQVGQEVHLAGRPTNKEAVQIDNGQAVYLISDASAIPAVMLANASDYVHACSTIAIATENVAADARGSYTSFGLVRDVDTSAWDEGDALWLSTTNGVLTNVRPTAPNCSVRIGYVMFKDASFGAIFVTVYADKAQTTRDITKEPTGFTVPENIDDSYDPITRKITLTGTVNGYYRGMPIAELTTGWESDAHADVVGTYLLSYDGSTFAWKTPSTLDFSDILIAFANYGAIDKFGIRECHGLLQWQAHKMVHDRWGTSRESGGDVADYALDSTIVADRRPSVSATLIADEDLPTLNPLLAANGPYNQFTLSSTETVNFDTVGTDIIPLSGNQPYYNEFTGGAWQQTLMTNNYYTSVWLVGMPVTSDADSQKYRYFFVQGQSQSALESTQIAISAKSVNLGEFNNLSPEAVYLEQFIVRYIGTNWVITNSFRLEGETASISGSQGSFLSSVTSDGTLSGNGTVSDPLSVVIRAKQEPFNPLLGQTVFTLAQTPADAAACFFYLNGQLRINPADYTFTGTALTWNDLDGRTLLTTDQVIIAYSY
jgi:hypothetical protein